MGRYITFGGMSDTALSLIPAVQDMLQASTYDQSRLQSMLTCLQTAALDGSELPSLALSGNRCFFSSDFMVQQRPAYYGEKLLRPHLPAGDGQRPRAAKPVFGFAG